MFHTKFRQTLQQFFDYRWVHLRLWRLDLVVNEGFVALHHLCWSQYPPRPGWARFQRELRGMAALPTPDEIADAAGLLLSLSMNFAAPGVSAVLKLAE